MKLLKIAGAVFFIFVILFFAGRAASEGISQKVNGFDSSAKNYLALGDSYTIGQSVEEADNFPNRLVTALQHKGIKINPPEIRAVTGLTTGDLIASLRTTPPSLQQYDLVSLLIGVNNQFQGRTIAEYEIEFRFLLSEAIKYAGGDKRKVMVISIPDYSVMPFAEGSDTKRISKEINLFNSAQKKIAAEAGVAFINITPVSRKGKNDPSLRADDGLHPSGKQYGMWITQLLPKAMEVLKS